MLQIYSDSVVGEPGSSGIEEIGCRRHQGKIRDMYCRKHDEILCQLCIPSKHRLCSEIQTVTKAIKQQAKKIQTLPHDVTKVLTLLEILIKDKTTDQDNINQSCEEILATISELRKIINDHLDELENKTKEQLKEMQRRIATVIQNDIDSCKALFHDLNKYMQEVKEKQKKDKVAAFVGFKKCETKMADAEILLQSITDKPYRIKFTSSTSIQELLASLDSFGAIETSPAIPTDSAQALAVVDSAEFNVKTSSDRVDCCITGVVRLANGYTVLADNVNYKVKLLDYKYNIIAFKDLRGPPQDVCAINKSEVAVSVWSSQRHSLQFFTASDSQLVRRRYIELDHDCCGLAYNNGNLYVGSLSTIYIYSLGGRMIKQLYRHTSGNVCRFAVSHDGEQIYITIKGYSMITIDSSGRTLRNFQDKELGFSTGITIASNGTIFVAGLYSCAVLQVDQEGETKLSTLATGFGGVTQPWSLFYDKITGNLVVGQENNKILVLKTKVQQEAKPKPFLRRFGDRR